MLMPNVSRRGGTKAGYRIEEVCATCGEHLRRTTLANKIYCPKCNTYVD